MNKNTLFFEQRQKRIHRRLDRSWQPVRHEPVLEGGNICYEVSGRIQAVRCGGLGLIQEVVEATGLRPALDEKVRLLKRRQPYFESDHVLTMALNLVAGGRCLDDIERHRKNEAFLDAVGAKRVPGASTAGDFLRRFTTDEHVESLMNAVNRASANVWRARPKKERALALIDVDGTIVETGGLCKEKMDIAYNGRWGFGPLVVSLANSQEVLWTLNRPANRPSHDAAAPCMDRAIRWALEQAGFKKVRLRGDTDFSLTTKFDGWDEQGVEFVFGMDANSSFVKRARAIENEAWKPMDRAKRPIKRKRPEQVKKKVVEERGFKTVSLIEEHVAELDYKPSKAKKGYRLIVLRKRLRVTEGQLRLEDEIRYFFYVTNIPANAMSPVGVVRESNKRCHQENLIEQLKNGVRATRMPVAEFHANWAYLVIGALAWNLKAWTGLVLPESLGARDLLKMEFARFLNEVILLPAQILRKGRQLVFRLLEVNARTPLLIQGVPFLKRRRRA